jgi:hypothetical protein
MMVLYNNGVGDDNGYTDEKGRRPSMSHGSTFAGRGGPQISAREYRHSMQR